MSVFSSRNLLLKYTSLFDILNFIECFTTLNSSYLFLFVNDKPTNLASLSGGEGEVGGVDIGNIDCSKN